MKCPPDRHCAIGKAAAKTRKKKIKVLFIHGLKQVPKLRLEKMLGQEFEVLAPALHVSVPKEKYSKLTSFPCVFTGELTHKLGNQPSSARGNGRHRRLHCDHLHGPGLNAL